MSYLGKVKIWDGTNYVPVTTRANTGVKALTVSIGPTDPISDIPVVMDFDHHQLHEGEVFRWASYTASLAANATKDIRFVVPNITVPAGVPVVRVVPHMRFEAVSSVGGISNLYEATTFSANGTQRTPVAMERNGTYTPQLQVWEDPTVNVLGTVLYTGLNTTNKQASGSTEGTGVEFVLKNNTSYHFRFTSGGNSNQVLVRFVWYEDLGV